MSEFDKYITFLLEKLYIFDFDKSSEIVCIKEIQKILLYNNKDYSSKKLKDIDYLLINKELLTKFKCFNILDIDYEDELSIDYVSVLFNQYKTYKQSSGIIKKEKEVKKEKEIKKEIYLLSNKKNLDTSNTRYIYSLDDISTECLINNFGELTKTGGENDKYRYEYKFEFTVKDKSYIYSLYDYWNSKSEFNENCDIYWHVASNTDDIKINKYFKNELINYIKNS